MKMNYADAAIIQQLTRKLKEQGDISLKEADGVYSLYSQKTMETILYPYSFSYDPELARALEGWYKVVAEKIEKGERGNFIFTVSSFLRFHDEYARPAQKAIEKYGTFEDLCSNVMIDYNLGSLFPFQHLDKINERKPDEIDFYKLTSFRAGMYYYPIRTKSGVYTVSQFMEKLAPFAVAVPDDTTAYDTARTFLRTASISKKLRELWSLRIKEAKYYTLGAYVNSKNISCAAAVGGLQKKAFIFVEKEHAPLVRKVLESFEFEELLENALRKNIINKKMVDDLLADNIDNRFPLGEFIDESVRYIDDIVRRKMEWEATQRAVEEEDVWLEEIR